MNPNELKNLQVLIARAKSAEETALLAKTEADLAYTKAANYRKSLEEKLTSAQSVPMITEHAVLRYIQRVYDFDIEEVKRSILTPATVRAVNTIISGKFPLPMGGTAVIKNRTIVSIMD